MLSFINVVEQDLDKVYRQFALRVWNNLQVLSPVDTGRYRRNHHVSLHSPSMAVDGGGGIELVMSLPQGQYPTIYIQNNLPYAERLEHGHSKQAPT
ncbi:MAG: HK97 gp10 family phage protein, partial [Acinetobacter sp.]|nr:HK97 gp10 family phage protein [Acinetobacter sp.]